MPASYIRVMEYTFDDEEAASVFLYDKPLMDTYVPLQGQKLLKYAKNGEGYNVKVKSEFVRADLSSFQSNNLAKELIAKVKSDIIESADLIVVVDGDSCQVIRKGDSGVL